MSEAQALAQLHAEVIASMTGNTVATTTEVTLLTGMGFFAPILCFLFFVLVWTGVPLMEKFINFLYKCVDKLHDFWN
jgi:hypothetical protein